MEPFIAYILKVNAALIIFYLLYVFLLKKDTFLVLRRGYFLLAIVFSCFYPFFAVHALGDIFPVREKAIVEEVQTMVVVGEPTMMAVVADDITDPAVTIPWEQVVTVLFVAITIVFALRFLWQLFSILRIRAKSEKKNLFGINVYHLSGEITPFSFFKWIFINTETHSDTELKQILLHEQTHARQCHSIDVILMELLCVVFWWNPFVWLLKRELAMNLEYLADNSVLQHGVNSKEYQYHLLRLTYHETAVPIVNNFNVSQLKQRIMMMNKTKSPVQKLAKYVAILPVLLLLVSVNSAFAQESKGNEIFIEIEKSPEYPGGNAELMKYLANNIKYPVIAMENDDQGRVVTNFVVEKDGSISNVRVIKGVTALLDAEAVRLVKGMPNWKPGEQRNQPVRVRFTLPVVFRLQGETSKTGKSPLTPTSPYADEKGKTLDEVVVVGYVPSSNRGTVPTTQELKEKEKMQAAVSKVVDGSEEIFVVVEDQPQFPGGTTAMMNFLGENIRYPKEAHEKGIQGRVIANFVVMKDGTISDVNIVRGVDPLLDNEAIRVLSSMPAWKPGKQRGQPVNVRFTLPVVFNLTKNEEPKEDGAKSILINKDEAGNETISRINSDTKEALEYSKFLAQNVKYPVIAQENGIAGLVKASYSVNENGEISNAKIVEGVDPSLEAEVLRIIKNIPKDIALAHTGGKANPSVSLSTLFRLEGVSQPLGSVDADLVVVGYGPEKKVEVKDPR